MAARINVIIVFILLFIDISQSASTSDAIELGISPTETQVGKTVTFILNIYPCETLKELIVHFFVDKKEIGAKKLHNIQSDHVDSIKFDYFFGKDDYLGEHYVEIRADYLTESQRFKSTTFYYSIHVNSSYDKSLWISFLIFLSIVIFLNYHNKEQYMLKIKLEEDRLKTIFNLLITVLPLSITIFISIIEKSWIKASGSILLLSFVISFIFALSTLRIDISQKVHRQSNFILSSLFLLFFGLAIMIASIMIL
jgi:hypothetical protein